MALCKSIIIIIITIIIIIIFIVSHVCCASFLNIRQIFVAKEPGASFWYPIFDRIRYTIDNTGGF